MMMKRKSRQGFAHNHALPWLFVITLVSAIAVPVCGNMHWRTPALALLVFMGIAAIATLVGEISLFLMTKRKQHLLLPIMAFVGTVTVVVIRVMK